MTIGKQPRLQNAPAVSVCSELPAEFPVPLGGTSSFLQMTLFPRHLQSLSTLTLAQLILQFYPFYRFHACAAKAALHAKMRAKIHHFLSILESV